MLWCPECNRESLVYRFNQDESYNEEYYECSNCAERFNPKELEEIYKEEEKELI